MCIKTVGENIHKYLSDPWMGKDFLVIKAKVKNTNKRLVYVTPEKVLKELKTSYHEYK